MSKVAKVYWQKARDGYWEWYAEFENEISVRLKSDYVNVGHMANICFGANSTGINIPIPSTNVEVAKRVALLKLVECIDEFIKSYELIKHGIETNILEEIKEVCRYAG